MNRVTGAVLLFIRCEVFTPATYMNRLTLGRGVDLPEVSRYQTYASYPDSATHLTSLASFWTKPEGTEVMSKLSDLTIL